VPLTGDDTLKGFVGSVVRSPCQKTAFLCATTVLKKTDWYPKNIAERKSSKQKNEKKGF